MGFGEHLEAIADATTGPPAAADPNRIHRRAMAVRR
jgi:hypothetical protein